MNTIKKSEVKEKAEQIIGGEMEYFELCYGLICGELFRGEELKDEYQCKFITVDNVVYGVLSEYYLIRKEYAKATEYHDKATDIDYGATIKRRFV